MRASNSAHKRHTGFPPGLARGAARADLLVVSETHAIKVIGDQVDWAALEDFWGG